MSDYSERRRYERVAARLRVRLSTIEPEQDPWTGRPFFRASQETCANVSRGGAFIRTGEPLTPGRRILVEVRLPDGRELEAIGRVAWTKRVIEPGASGDDTGIGVEFLGGAADQFGALEEFIDGRRDDLPPDPGA